MCISNLPNYLYTPVIYSINGELGSCSSPVSVVAQTFSQRHLRLHPCQQAKVDCRMRIPR